MDSRIRPIDVHTIVRVSQIMYDYIIENKFLCIQSQTSTHTHIHRVFI